MFKQLARVITGKVASAPVPGEQSPSYYDELYAGSEEYLKPYWQSRYYFLWTVICDRLKNGGAQEVLEIGCGSGQFSELLHRENFATYVGMDISVEAIRQAKQKPLTPFRFEVADALVTDLLDEQSYDSVVCTEVLEHIEKDRELIQRIKPGTRCLCTVPNFPYVSHVRHFNSSEEVQARYQSWFDDLKVWELAGSHKEGTVYYLFDGIKT